MKLLSRRRTVPIVIVALMLSAPVFAQDHAAHYVLDAFGGVHAGGGAPVISPATPYFGFDVATDIAYIPVGTGSAQGDGILVLDKWGGVHAGGALAFAPPSSRTPYFGFDAARAIVYRDIPTKIGFMASGQGQTMDLTTNASFVPVLTMIFNAPVDGFVHVVGQAAMACKTQGNLYLLAALAVNVGVTSDPLPLSGIGLATFDDCNLIGGNVWASTETYSIVLPIERGARFIHLLARKSAGTSDLRIFGRSLTVQFIGPNALGQTTVPGPTASPAGDLSNPPAPAGR